MKIRLSLYLLACLLVVASCNRPVPIQTTATPVPVNTTQIPAILKTATPSLPPVITATISPQPTLPPSATPVRTHTPTPTSTTAPTKAPSQAPTKSPTLAPTYTPAPTTTQVVPTGFPQVPEAIRILQPGPNSSLRSPVTVAGEADPTFEQHLLAKVAGENGAALNTKATTIQVPAGERGPFSLQIPFTVSKNQPGRVAVWSTSAKDGGLIHFSSVDVALLAGGSAKILAQTQSANEVLVITQPALNSTASGGKLLVQGWSGPVFENALVVVLCGEGGSGKTDPFCGTADNILARVPTTTHAPDVGQPGAFSVEVSYHVNQTVSGRVAVYYTSPRDGYLLHLSSAPVKLEP